MTRAEMLAELRETISDDVVTYKWSDARLLGYLAEGQDEFCEQTGYFTDFTSHTITLATDTATYAIPDRVIEVLDIWDGTRRLGKFQESDRGFLNTDWDPAQTASNTGRPNRWQADRETGSITFDRTPTAAENGDTLQLRVWRYSADALDDAGIEPEIPSRFHRACIEWAAYKAMNTHDAEKQDKIKAVDHFRAFNDYVVKGRRARRRYEGVETRVGSSPAYRT